MLFFVYLFGALAYCGDNVTEAGLGEECDGGACCSAANCTFVFHLCRAAADACDKPEYCTTASADCPPDEYEPAFTPCHPAAGLCDKTEVCDGVSLSCPADTYLSSTTVCRPVQSGHACDIEELCTGTAAECPADVVVEPGVVCRTSAGACDIAETCDGAATTCPTDAFVSASANQTCRAASVSCDGAEYCTGSSAACPANLNATEGTVCDDGSSCTGPDQCSAGGQCSGEWTCPCMINADCAPATSCAIGSCIGGSCAYMAAANSVECRPKAGVCDVAEFCDGFSLLCPADVREPTTAVCRSWQGVCDVSETCAGDVNCPSDAKVAASTVCFPATEGAACDEPERCDGVTNACPSVTKDVVKPAGTMCRSSTGASKGCDAAEFCDGWTKQCPVDVAAPNGASCDDSIACTVADSCLAKYCRGVFACKCVSDFECDDFNPCTADACVGGYCQNIPGGDLLGSLCDDLDGCTGNDACQSDGTCVGTTSSDGDGVCPSDCSIHGKCCTDKCLCTDSYWAGTACLTQVDSFGSYHEQCNDGSTCDHVSFSFEVDGRPSGVIAGEYAVQDLPMHIVSSGGILSVGGAVGVSGDGETLDDKSLLDNGESVTFSFTQDVQWISVRLFAPTVSKFRVDGATFNVTSTAILIDLASFEPSPSLGVRHIQGGGAKIVELKIMRFVYTPLAGGSTPSSSSMHATASDSLTALAFSLIAVLIVAPVCFFVVYQCWKRRPLRTAEIPYSSSSSDSEQK